MGAQLWGREKEGEGTWLKEVDPKAIERRSLEEGNVWYTRRKMQEWVKI